MAESAVLPAESIGGDAPHLVAVATTALFVPGNRPDRFSTALTSGADVVIVDLEDAVPAGARPAARVHVGEALTAGRGMRMLVRVSAFGTPDGDADLRLCLNVAGRAGHGLLGLVVAKASDAGAAQDAGHRLRCTSQTPLAVVPLVESAAGMVEALALARAVGVTRLALGAQDYAADLGADPDGPAVEHARALLVLASRAADIAPPLDSPSVEIGDSDAVRAAARRARAHGFGGSLCIHPRQVVPVLAGHAPGSEELVWAREVLSAGEGATAVGGRLVDPPVLARARRVLRAQEALDARRHVDQTMTRTAREKTTPDTA